MQKVNVKEARKNIAKLLNEVISGKEIIILRRGRPVARLSKADSEEDSLTFPSREEFRAQFPPASSSAAKLIRNMRNERG